MNIQNSKEFEVGGRRAAYVLIICSLLNMVSYADSQVISVVLQQIKAELGLSDSQLGGATGAYYLGIIVFTLPISHLVDIWSRKKMIGIMALVWSFFTLATGMVGSFTALLVTRAGVGAGEAGFLPGGTALVSASYPEEQRGRKLGLFNMFLTVGVVAGVIAGGVLSTHFGWRTAFYVFGIPGIVLGLLAFFMQDYTLQKADGSAYQHDSFWTNLKQLLKIPTLRWLYVGLGMFAVLQISVGTWTPSLLMRAYGIKEDKAGLIMGLVTVIGLAGPILGGIIADKWHQKVPGGRMRLAAISIAFAAVFLLLILVAAFDINNKGLMIFCGLMMPLHSIAAGMALPAVAATTQDVVPPKMKGLAWGTGMLALFLLGGAWGPAMVGAISDHYAASYQGLALGIAVAGLFGFAACWMWFMTARHVESDMKRAKEAIW